MGGPSGTVTFLFTDVEGSTRLWEAAPEAMRAGLERHDGIVRAAIEAHGGFVFATSGDGFAAAFARAGEAVAAGMAAQAALGQVGWAEGVAIKVRMAVHTGEVVERDGDYFGTPVNQTARLMGLGHGGQLLCSAVTAGLLGDQWPLVALGEHRLRDLATPQRVFQVGAGSFPPLRSAEVVPSNLPVARTGLVGRDSDVAALSVLVGRQRLVTLTGSGGVGKTRLAVAVAAACAPSFPDGCWLVELAPAGSGDEVVRAVTAAMGGPVTDRAGLGRYLSDRRVLIVLDNCEHVLSEAARVAEAVLGAGPEVVIVATSREPLGVAGEVVRVVHSLVVPDDDAVLAEASAAPAVRLFVERAVSASDTFALDEHNLGAVVQICRQLDGIPLAIELAAARVRAMAPAEIARRLSERFGLLGGGRGSLERHRTLLGAVSWSYDLLSDEQRRVFRRLAVFPASFDLEAAEAVAGGDPELDADVEVVECVVGLVDRSLVGYDPTGGRYRLLETLRQYGADRLAEAGEHDATWDAHARFYTTLAAYNGPHGSDATVPRFTAELDNIRAVADWLAERGAWSDLLELCRNLFLFIQTTVPHEALRWYRQAIVHLPQLTDQERIDVLGEVGMIDVTCSDYRGDGSWAQSIALAETTGLRDSPWAWVARTQTHTYSHPAEARLAAQRAITAAEAGGDGRCATAASGTLAVVLANLGELDESREVAEDTLRRARRHGDLSTLASAVVTLSASYVLRAEPNFAAAMDVFDANPVDEDSVEALFGLWLHQLQGLTHLGLDHPQIAVEHLSRSVRLADRAGVRYSADQAVWALALASARAGQLELAAQLIGYARAQLAPHRLMNRLQPWLEERVSACLATLEPSDRQDAEQDGAGRDRRGFLQLVSRVEQATTDLSTR